LCLQAFGILRPQGYLSITEGVVKELGFERHFQKNPNDHTHYSWMTVAVADLKLGSQPG